MLLTPACGNGGDDRGSGSGAVHSSGGAGGTGGGAGHGSGATAGESSGGQGAGGHSGQGTGGVQNGPACPPDAPASYQPCPAGVNPDGCTYSAPCNSGEVHSFHFQCDDQDQWVMTPQACEYPSDRCGDLTVSCGDGYWRFWGTVNLVAACPESRPAEGDPCTPNDADCGYFCDDASTWTVLYCDGSNWVGDGACN
ncbi:MAG: hypothetical protein R3B07_15345 [Polyangiaceae bacterium]